MTKNRNNEVLFTIIAALLAGCFPGTRPLNEAELFEAERVGVAYEEAFSLELSDDEWACLLDVRVAVVDDTDGVCRFGDPSDTACYTNRIIDSHDNTIVLPEDFTMWLLRHELTHRLLDCIDDEDKNHTHPMWAVTEQMPDI